MAARQGLLEDLMELGSRLQPRVALALAGVSYMVFHVISVETVLGASTHQGATISAAAQISLIYLCAASLQYIVPFCLCIGALVCVLRRRRADRLVEEARSNTAGALSAMSWRDFERLVGGAFVQRGYSVIETGGDGPDGGIDLILTKDAQRYLVQCKHWKSWQVGVSIVRELKGVVAAEGAAGGYVVTGGNFTADARRFARKTGIKLIDGNALKEFIGIAAGTVPHANSESSAQSAPVCPKCGGDMIQREAARGQFVGRAFWGWRQFPKCRGILPID
jgi:restriction system protein